MLAGLALLLAASTGLVPQEAPIETADVQKECPVMAGNPIDRSIFAVYQGKKVYFCCASCKQAFEAHPEKYLARLPQFAVQAAASPEGGTGSQGASQPLTPAGTPPGFRLGRLIVPLGIAAFTAVAATVLTGLFRKLRYRLMIRLHMTLGVIALIIAACHGAIVILLD
jgi:YHS domain-containing protein